MISNLGNYLFITKTYHNDVNYIKNYLILGLYCLRGKMTSDELACPGKSQRFV